MNFVIYMAVLCSADGLRNYEALWIVVKDLYFYFYVDIEQPGLFIKM